MSQCHHGNLPSLSRLIKYFMQTKLKQVKKALAILNRIIKQSFSVNNTNKADHDVKQKHNVTTFLKAVQLWKKHPLHKLLA